jgi:adenosine deaminase CECR1
MGILCSSIDKDADDPVEGKAQAHIHTISSPSMGRLQKMPQMGRRLLPSRSRKDLRTRANDDELDSEEGYFKALEALQLKEKERAFDHELAIRSSNVEKEAAALLKKVKLYDWDHTYGPTHDEHGKPTGRRTQGRHFLGSVDHINQTELMKVARRMPKGAHLHIHFNSCLPAKFLIQQARDIDAMYIRSTHALTTPENRSAARISFMVMTPYEATHVKDADGIEVQVALGNIWDKHYVSNRWMSYKVFQKKFDIKEEDGHHLKGTAGAETWLERKMQISEEEAHNTHQTGRG